MKTLLVHIGTGKTGSTAIQHALAKSSEVLRKNGIDYWGLNLEGCEQAARLHPWQKDSGTPIFQKLSVADAKQQLRQVLDLALETMADGNLGIWSNESICERTTVYVPVIREACEAAGVACTIPCYVRNHRSYANSAYKQWGVKHKTYAGRILGFRDWIRSRKSFLSYGRLVKVWNDAFGDALRLVNYDTVSDVVQHFARYLPEPALLLVPKKRLNVAPPQALVALYALHNNQLDGVVHPRAVGTLLQRYPLAGSHHEMIHLASIFPSAEALEEVEELLQDDTELVNDLFRRHGQPELRKGNQDADEQALQTSDVHTSMLSVLLKLFMLQDERISELEKQLGVRNLA
jgi:hypothetical protein